MFDEKEHMDQDFLMKSILENGQENVPARVWDGISEELDTIARHRKSVLIWRRASLSVAAAAAAVIIGVFTYNQDSEDIIPQVHDQNLVSVIEEEPVIPDITFNETTVAVQAEKIASYQLTAQVLPHEDSPAENICTNPPAVSEEPSVPLESQEPASSEKEESYDAELDRIWNDDIFEDDNQNVRKRRTTLTISGITGSNNPNDKAKSGALRQPSYSKAPTRTSIAESSEKNTFGIPMSFGAGVKIDLSDKWSVGTGIEYTLLSRKFYGTYIKVNEKGGIEHSTYSDIRNNQHYIGIPLNVFYNVLNNNHINFYAYAGGAIERCVSDSYHLLNTSIVHKEAVGGVQWSANAGLGVEFMLGRHLGLYVDPRIEYYFHGNQPKSIRTEQPLMAGIEMGMRIRL